RPSRRSYPRVFESPGPLGATCARAAFSSSRRGMTIALPLDVIERSPRNAATRAKTSSSVEISTDGRAARFDDITVEVPPGWGCRTIRASSAPETAGGSTPPSLIVTREVMAPDEILHSMIDQRLIELRRASRFRVLSHHAHDLNGMSAVTLVYEWA